jgi:hypothetical protein
MVPAKNAAIISPPPLGPPKPVITHLAVHISCIKTPLFPVLKTSFIKRSGIFVAPRKLIVALVDWLIKEGV